MVNASGSASLSWPTKCRFSAYIGNCNAMVISVLMVSYHNKLEIKDTMIYIIGMEVRFLRRHKYGDCSSVGRAEDCGSSGHGFKSHHSPRNKLMEQWQMWSLHRTENPKELDRNQPAPRKCSDGEVGNALVCKTNIRQFESDSGLKYALVGKMVRPSRFRIYRWNTHEGSNPSKGTT